MSRYEITFKSAMMWANAELEHVGRIASMKDADLQYAYAMSTLNGMAHLKDALAELVEDPEYATHHTDLQRTHDAVVRVMRHLKAEYDLDVDTIRAFNTRHTLQDLSYLNVGNASTSNNGSNASISNSSSNSYNASTSKNTINRMQDGGKRTRKTRKSRKQRR